MTDLRQRHFRIRTDASAVDAAPTWAAAEDTTYFPGNNNFRLRVGLLNAGPAQSAVPWQLYVSKNGAAYSAVTTSSTSGVKSADAGSSADEASIVVPRLSGLSAPYWVYEAGANGYASIDLDFANGRYYGGALADLLSCSRASIGYANTAAGTLTQFGNNELRITNLGLLVEGSRTNVVLWNRDLTSAAWAPSNITPLKDQAGPDGISNSASSLLATSDNGTILQSITLASSARFQSAWVKRLVGSGTINMTMDNGSTWTAVTITSDWTRVTIPTQTLANPTVGFRIVTSGDKIAVDLVQNEDNAGGGSSFASSPIPTTTASAARASDVDLFAGSLDTLVQALPFTVLLDIKTTATPNDIWGFFGASGGNVFPLYTSSADTQAYSQISSEYLEPVFAGGRKFSTGVKIACAMATDARSVVGGGGTVVTGTSAAALGGAYSRGFGQGNANQMYGYIRRATFWNSKLDDTTLQALTYD